MRKSYLKQVRLHFIPSRVKNVTARGNSKSKGTETETVNVCFSSNSADKEECQGPKCVGYCLCKEFDLYSKCNGKY